MFGGEKIAIIGASYLQKPLVEKAKEMGVETICFAWAEGAVCRDVRVIETHPKVFDEKQLPRVFRETEDGSIDKIGDTDMKDGEMRALLQQRKVQNVRIYHKGDVWHCFYGTMKGLNGQEQGAIGSHPHYHYISNKWGIKLEDLLQRMQANDMPSSIHILFKRDLISQ